MIIIYDILWYIQKLSTKKNWDPLNCIESLIGVSILR